MRYFLCQWKNPRATFFELISNGWPSGWQLAPVLRDAKEAECLQIQGGRNTGKDELKT